jgi:hypothetical protein
MIEQSSFYYMPDPKGTPASDAHLEPDNRLCVPNLNFEMRADVSTNINRASLEPLLDSLYTHWRNEKPIVARLNGDLRSAPMTEALQGKKLLLVDDIPVFACIFGIELMLATQGNAAFVIHQSQSVEELAAEIIVHEPSILIMDGILVGAVRGWDVIRAVLLQRPKLICIGFSSDPDFEQTFIDAGAVGFVHKRYDMAKECMTELAQITHPFFSVG